MASHNRPHEGRAVCLGGGTGTAVVARALLRLGFSATAVVTTSDSGRSSGKLRETFVIPAVGDLRQCLTSCASPRNPWSRLLETRLIGPLDELLNGMPIGNLALLTQLQNGSNLSEACATLCRMLRTPVTVLPATEEHVDLWALLTDGTAMRGEEKVRMLDKAPISHVSVHPPNPTANPLAVDAIRRANVVVLGPGSLYTSVLACLAVPGLAEAVRLSSAPKVFVANLATQPGQTDGMDLTNHIQAVLRALGPNTVQAMVVNDRLSRSRRAIWKANQFEALLPDEKTEEELAGHGIALVRGRLVLESRSTTGTPWEKVNYPRHSPHRLAEALREFVTAHSATG